MPKEKFKQRLDAIVNNGKQILIGINDIHSCLVEQAGSSTQQTQNMLKVVSNLLNRTYNITEFIFNIIQNSQIDDFQIGLRQFFILSYSQLISQNGEDIKNEIIRQMYKEYNNINIELFKYYQINMMNVLLQRSNDDIFKLINCLSPYQIEVFLTKINRFQNGLYSITDIENFMALSFYSLGTYVKELSYDINDNNLSNYEWVDILFQGIHQVHYQFTNMTYPNSLFYVVKNIQTNEISCNEQLEYNNMQYDIIINQPQNSNQIIRLPNQQRSLCYVGNSYSLNQLQISSQLQALHLCNCQFSDIGHCSALKLLTLQNVNSVDIVVLQHLTQLKSAYFENIQLSHQYDVNNVVQQIIDNVAENLQVLQIKTCNSDLIVKFTRQMQLLKFLVIKNNIDLVICNFYIENSSFQSLQFVDSDVAVYFSGAGNSLQNLYCISAVNDVDINQLQTGRVFDANLQRLPPVINTCIQMLQSRRNDITEILKKLLIFYMKSQNMIEKYSTFQVIIDILDEKDSFKELYNLFTYNDSYNELSNILIQQLQLKYTISLQELFVKAYIAKITNVFYFQNNNLPYKNEQEMQQFINSLFENIENQVYIKINYQFQEQMIFVQDVKTRQITSQQQIHQQNKYNVISYLNGQNVSLNLNIESLCAYNKIGTYSEIRFDNDMQIQDLKALSLSWCNYPNLQYAKQIKILSLVCVNNVDIQLINQSMGLELIYIFRIVLLDEASECNGVQIMNALQNKYHLKKVYMRYCYFHNEFVLNLQSEKLFFIHLERNFNLSKLIITDQLKSLNTLQYIFLEPRYRTDKLILSLRNAYLPNLFFIHCYNFLDVKKILQQYYRQKLQFSDYH